MDTFFKILAIAIVTVLAVLVVRPIRGDFAIIISVVGGLIIVFYLISYLGDVFDVFDQIFTMSGLNSSLYSVIFKIIGVGYLTEFSVGICADTGNPSLGDKVLLGGKIVILVLALPIVTSILDIIVEILPS